MTDGSPSTLQSGGATVKTSAAWKDRTLRVVSSVDEFSLSFNDEMNLSADGKTLTSTVLISLPQGDVDLTIVFERQ